MKMGMKIFGMILQFWKLNRRFKMEAKPITFDEYVVRDILTNNSYGISEVCCLRSIKSMYLERERYPLIVSLMENENLAELMKLPEGTMPHTFPEYLEIVQFESQDGRSFIATLYDSVELWQNPEIIDVFLLASAK